MEKGNRHYFLYYIFYYIYYIYYPKKAIFQNKKNEKRVQKQKSKN